MAKTKPVLAAPTLSDSKVKAIAKVWIAGERNAAIAGGGLALAIAEAAGECGGNRTDALNICQQVGAARSWGDTTVGIRASQCVAFLKVGLPAMKRGIAAVTKSFDACSFEMAYWTAKAIIDGEDPVEVITEKKSQKHGAARTSRAKGKGKGKGKGNLPKTSDEAVPFVFRELLKLELPRGLAFDLKALAAKYEYKL